MAKDSPVKDTSATRGKRTRTKSTLKNAPAGRRRLKAKAQRAFPGGASKTEREVERVVPRVTRS
jgi:hypothetical protein